AGRRERLGVERGVTDLAVSGDARRKRHAGAGAEIVLAAGVEAFARASEAVGEFGRAAAGRELALDADEQAAEGEVVTGVDAVNGGIGIGADRTVGRIDVDAFIAGDGTDIEPA